MSKMSTRIKEAREALGATQAELAKQAHLTAAAVCQFEKGARTPSLQTLIQLSEALKINIDYLLGSNVKRNASSFSVERLFRGLTKLTLRDSHLLLEFYEFLKARNSNKYKNPHIR